jgi:methylase of polypeptide subunit release factors
MEHDDTQGELVAAVLRRDGLFSDVQTREDLNGRPRYTIAARTDGTMAR